MLIFSRFTQSFSRFIRDVNGEKNISLLMIFFTASFSRFTPSRVSDHLQKYVFFAILLGILGALCVAGKGRPWYGTSAQPETHFTCSSPRYAPRVVPSTFLLGRGEGGVVRCLCKTHWSLHGRHVREMLKIHPQL